MASSVYLFWLFCYIFQFGQGAEKEKKGRDVFMHTVDDDKYETLLLLVQGNFNVPVSQRTRSQKSAVVRFWRRKDLFSLGSEVSPTLYFNGRKVVKKSDVSRIVGKTFKETKSAGYKKLKYRAADSYAGLTERQIRQVTSSNIKYRIHNAAFTNKVVPKPVRANHVQSQHQIDLVDLNKQPVQYAGKTYRYILSVMDVFSRYLWLAPLQKKSSRCTTSELQKIYERHGPPGRLQSDQGLEFYGRMENLCKKYKIRRIRSRPYHPQSQGKVERSHRRLHDKMRYDLLSMKKKGVNWAKTLPTYCRILNEEKKEELGWLSPFEVYYGRKSNVVVKASLEDYDIDSCPAGSLKTPSRKDVSKHRTGVENIRERAKSYTRKLEKRMIDKHTRLNPPAAQYKPGEEVLLRVKSGKGKIAPKRRHVVKGKVISRNLRTSMYKVSFVNPNSNEQVQKWISVEDITSVSCREDKEKRKKQERKKEEYLHRKKYLIPLTSQDRLESLADRGDIAFNPPGDGNCQFSALCFWLRSIGIERTPKTLRREIVRYLRENPNDLEGSPLELFAGQPWSDYLAEMIKDGTYGDHITLQAAANLFNVQLNIHSSLGEEGNTIISPFATEVAVANFHLGHFAEGQGEHYVCLEIEPDSNDESTSEEMEENYERENEEKNEQEKDEVGKDEERETRGQTKQKGKGDSTEKVVDQTAKEHVFDLINEHQNEANFQESDIEQSTRKGTCSFAQLPDELVSMILETALRSCGNSNPGDVCILFQRLRNVCSLFRDCINRFTDLLPRIYYPDGSPGVISVRRLIRQCGSSSGLIIELKRIINTSRWHNAWLKLYFLGLGWFRIQNIFWRK